MTPPSRNLPVGGARFAVSGVEGELIVGSDGGTPAIELLPGLYTVTEMAPPPGYGFAGPWEVEIAEADVVLEASDRAARGRSRIEKVSAGDAPPHGRRQPPHLAAGPQEGSQVVG